MSRSHCVTADDDIPMYWATSRWVSLSSLLRERILLPIVELSIIQPRRNFSLLTFYSMLM